MSLDVLCLRPKADFTRAGVEPPRNLTILYRAPGDDDVAALMKQARALVVPAVGPKFDPALFAGTRLRLVQVTGAGVDRLDRESLVPRDIPVCNVPGGSNSALAEYTVTCASLLLRRLMWASHEIRRGNYVSFRASMVADNLAGIEGLQVGLVGLGTIGLAVAGAFAKAGARLAFHDPSPRDADAARELGAIAMPFDDLLGTADVVSLHVPLHPQTTNLIGAAQLARMKKGAILIQAARGGIVDEEALAAALRSGHLGGAAVDVYEKEPPELTNALLALSGEAADRLILTPHIAGVTRQSSATLFQRAWDNVERVLIQGMPPDMRVF
jgi:phosphoglycerate dehydrogenase-like enzyme